MAARRITFRVQPPVPFGDVTMLPALLTGRPEAEMARAMARVAADVPSAAEACRRFARTALSARWAALRGAWERRRPW